MKAFFNKTLFIVAPNCIAAWLFAFSISAVELTSQSTPPTEGFENRCGWVDNPTPANWDLTDKDGTWSIGVQGGHQAEGDLPEFPNNKNYWIKTNGNYGYGCACLRVKVDKKEKTVLEIQNGRALPLAKCRADKNLKSETR